MAASAPRSRIFLTAPTRTETSSFSGSRSQTTIENVKDTALEQCSLSAKYEKKGFYVNGLSAGNPESDVERINRILWDSFEEPSSPPKDVELHRHVNFLSRESRVRSSGELCGKIRTYLNDDRFKKGLLTPRVALFGHSAGSLIVARAYMALEDEYKKRVRIVLFGGVRTVKGEEGEEGEDVFNVLNVIHATDSLAIGAQWIFKKSTTEQEVVGSIELPPLDPAGAIEDHSAEVYLNNPAVKVAIQWAMEPDPT